MLPDLARCGTPSALQAALEAVNHADARPLLPLIQTKGRIIEEGSHTELLEKQGLYAKLWAHQSGGFLSEHVEWENN